MELGSAEHKHLLIRNIVKVAIKTVTLGLILGVILMVPSLLRENAFSIGLFYLGATIIFSVLIYSGVLTYKKYQRLIKPFNSQFKQKTD